MAEKDVGMKLRERLDNIRERLRSTGARIILFVVVVALTAALFFEIRAYAIRLDYFIFDPATLSLGEKPKWVTAQIEKEILSIPSLSKPFSLVEPDIARRIGRDLERMPWVRKVHAVRKYFPNRLEIEMALRTPVGWAESRGTLHLVDADGVCLPRTASARDGTEFAGLPVFTGLTKDAPEAGKPWADESLRAGLSLAGLIQYSGHPATERVVRIDCKANQAAVVENIVVFTDKGTAIYWGKPSYASNPLELAPEKKLANLLGLLEYYDDQRLATYRYIDLRYYEAPRAGKLGLAQKTE